MELMDTHAQLQVLRAVEPEQIWPCGQSVWTWQPVVHAPLVEQTISVPS